MGNSAERPLRTGWQVETANDVFKRGSSARGAWCTVLAAVVHAAVLLWTPAWERSATAPARDSGSGLFPVRLISIGEQAGGPGGSADKGDGVPASLAAGPGGADLADPAAEAPSLSLADLWDRIASSSSSVVPTVVASEPIRELDTRVLRPDPAHSVDIHGGATSTAGLTLVPHPGELDLESVSAVRPELALMDPSSWVLIRNPVEVDRFMRRTYELGELSPGEEGFVGVALWIDERGSVQWAEIDRSSGRTEMDEVALELFREVAVFRPARDEGVPVSRSAIFWVRFPWDGRPTDTRSRLQ